jgi:hypothetical protein
MRSTKSCSPSWRKSPFSATPLPNFAPPSSPFNSIIERVVKSVRIVSLFSLFSFAIFFDSSKRISPDSGVPYPLISIVGFAIFAILFPYAGGLASPSRRIDLHDPVAEDGGSPQDHSIGTLFAAVH